ncbi:histone H2A deubiquitinase MYSM1-like [Dreissena polymorpha]|uniref:Myb-like, SWIRM and MPN domain-containing protein 1 n=1 Tax=Dreissena polymorpha TaxID=45954 RepID=A0A9D3Y9L6_DREPO|nr:histone H2A deubiquitinase MYSM1-like [Dreissena polymorpha]KAH3695802.1 hypothetical protein DPMN_083261 [Dreissena polymorpha]
MADEGEVDVLGDFDMKIEVSDGIYDVNELPSQSANLLPEFTDHPWILDQSWAMDSSMDEKSKATIEKMLLEEQYYINGKVPRRKMSTVTKKQSIATRPQDTPAPSEVEESSSNPVHKLKSQTVSLKEHSGSGTGNDLDQVGDRSSIIPRKRANKGFHDWKKILCRSLTPWTEEEKKQFHQGLMMYGKKWVQIAKLLPGKTIRQVKNYGHQVFKIENKEEAIAHGLVRPNKSSVEYAQKALSKALSKVSTARPTVRVREPKKKPFLPPCKFNKNNPVRSRKIWLKPKSVINKNVLFNANQKGKDGDFETAIKTEATLEVKAGGNGESVGFDSTIVTVEKDSDEDIEVDIEDDDGNDKVNPLLEGRAVSPNSVYERLLNEAKLEQNVQEKIVRKGVQGRSYKVKYKGYELMSDSYSDSRPSGGCASGIVVKNETIGVDANTQSRDTASMGKQLDNAQDGIKKEISSPEVTVKCEPDLPDGTYKVASKQDEAESMQKDIPRVIANVVITVSDEVVHFPVPTEELVMAPDDQVSDREREVLKEFFEYRGLRTPERYLRIRNYILEAWKKCKPSYLFKTSVRSGLKKCGDVNSIGRVHAYLEAIGAINFGCSQVAYKNPRPALWLTAGDYGSKVCIEKRESMRPKKRKALSPLGAWHAVMEKTIEHTEGKKSNENGATKCVSVKRRVYDPFKLIPCLPFTEERPAPFLVEICCSSLMVMDIHSHICKTEVIGMLGGQFSPDTGKLTITMATPCHSISTGLQCEMDPVSQTQASEEIQGAGMDVVGWYHSHPCFRPDPSIRDIETQLKFQEWFAKGGDHFVGVIVTPYNPGNSSVSSQVTCLTVSDEISPDRNYNIPYKFDFCTCPCEENELLTVAQSARQLAASYATFPSNLKVDMGLKFRPGMTCLDKLCESLKAYDLIEDQGYLIQSVQEAFKAVVKPASKTITNSSYMIDQPDKFFFPLHENSSSNLSDDELPEVKQELDCLININEELVDYTDCVVEVKQEPNV